MAYPLNSDHSAPDWINSGVKEWREFSRKSIDKLDCGFNWMVSTDVVAFYDNIDHARLLSTLREFLRQDCTDLRLLRSCLRTWSHGLEKGIPQGYSASDILAKAYLFSFDLEIRQAGLEHLRYVDDLRLFCSSEQSARAGLATVIRLLHSRGLAANSAKSTILDRNQAVAKINDVTTAIDRIQKELRQEIEEEFDGYPTSSDVLQMIESADPAEVTVLERAFLEYFGKPSQAFNKSLFHFLLRRLGRAKSRVAVDFCIDALFHHPEETPDLVDYFRAVTLSSDETERVFGFLSDDFAIYDYQLYHLCRWLEALENLPDRVRARLRNWCEDGRRDPCLRHAAILLLGRKGDSSDRECVFRLYVSANEKTRCYIIEALRDMEIARRNSWYAEAGKQSPLLQRAVAHGRRSA